MLRWRSDRFFNRPAKLLNAIKDGGWFDVEASCPLLKGKCFSVMREHYYAAPVRRNKWGCQCFFNRPSRLKSIRQSPSRYAYFVCPCFSTHGFAVQSKQPVLGIVGSLFLFRAPLAVFWLIVAIVVDSVQRIAWTWFCSHVFYEVRKRLSPLIAHSDASSAISTVMRGVWIVASCFHHLPRLIFRSVARAMLMVSHTAARRSVPASKMASCYGNFFTALASTKPNGSSATIFACVAKYGQRAVQVSCFIFRALRNNNRLIFSHLTFLYNDMVVRAVWKCQVPSGLLYLSTHALKIQLTPRQLFAGGPNVSQT